MEILIGLAVVAAVAWFVLSGAFNTKVRDPATLPDRELEDAYIELKKSILATNVYEQETAYHRLYYRINSVLAQIKTRHQHFILDREAKGLPEWGLFNRVGGRDSNGMPKMYARVPRDLDPDKFEPDLLLYLCFFLWHGGTVARVGEVESDTELMSRLLDYLTDTKSYAPALFLKGMVAKYGEKHSKPIDFPAARKLLEAAQSQGVGAASVELQHLDRYAILHGLKSASEL